MPATVKEFEDFSSLFGGNSVFVEELYQRFLADPSSVDASWQELFKGFKDDLRTVERNVEGASWAAYRASVIGQVNPEDVKAKKAANDKTAPDENAIKQAAADSVRALMLIRAYRVRGHLAANLDPLGIIKREAHPDLDPASYGFTDADYDRPIFLNGELGFEQATLRQIINILRQTYCGTIGVEFRHIQVPEQIEWVQERIESAHGRPDLSIDEKKAIFKLLAEVEVFEEFLQVKYPGMKRFSVQGGDVMVAGLEAAIKRAAEFGVKDINIGMPHRGRMNVLTTVMRRPFLELFSLFHGNLDYPEGIKSSGDVKYHLGTSTDRDFGEGRNVHMSLISNPSHLEAVDPVISGRVRAKQDMLGDTEERLSCMGITMHGDAAFAGQGLVAEVLGLSDLKGYRTGGTLRIVVNNQIGFTTNPTSSRSSPYPTDVAKMVGAPIFHVNADDPDAVIFVFKLATEFRMQFAKDVVVDVICYRKYGHNESDEPMFTQPIMYNTIRSKDSPSKMYGDSLIAQGVMSEADVQKVLDDYKAFFEKEYEAAKNYNPNKADWLSGRWSGFFSPEGTFPQVDTGVKKDQLKKIGLSISRHPEGYNINSKILRQLDTKKKMIETGKDIDWATAEALAFGTLLTEGFSVRLSGQDCCRGTFSQRHAELVDQTDERRYQPLNNLDASQSRFEVYNSSLSEYGVLGFEYGYSQAAPNTLTLWEAQFGDFANGAQVMIDQFIASGEIKWLRMSGLVMLLPHASEGQGPEHSSARPERFLQLCAQDNMQVANCSTPANYFHILRRQLLAKFRKPLVLMTPKSLLRHKLCVSTLDELSAGTHFTPVIGEIDKIDAKKARRVIICSGKVYYDLLEARRERKISDVAIIRLEQFYPFPAKELAEELKSYGSAEIVWCQEEPRNMGGWSFVRDFIEEVMVTLKRKDSRAGYAGRPSAASPACGYLKIHNREQQELIDAALG